MEFSLGTILKNHRESKGWSLDHVARHAKIASHYVQALEEGRLSAFPAKIYALGHLRRLCFYLNIKDAGDMEKVFEREWDKRVGTAGYGANSRGGIGKKLSVTPGFTIGLVLGVIVLFFAGLFGMQLDSFIGRPSLDIHSPTEGALVFQPFIKIEGKGERESQLTVNGREITLSESGAFREYIELVPGVNVLHFYLENRFGKLTEKVRHVVVK
jgi:transcriptional regulator with XRE-family HTH domain